MVTKYTITMVKIGNAYANIVSDSQQSYDEQLSVLSDRYKVDALAILPVSTQHLTISISRAGINVDRGTVTQLM